MANNMKDRVVRFGALARFTHWAHVVCFFLLVLTGFSLYSNWFSWLSVIFLGGAGAKTVHHVSAVLFVVLPLISLILNFNGFKAWMKEVFTWDADDKRFMTVFYRKFLGLPGELPPQGRFNAGQKLNSIAILLGCILMAITGFAMWFHEAWPLALVLVSYPLHDLGAAILLAAVIGHGYLAALHPDSRASLEAMLKGTLPVAFAKHHHAKWYQTVSKGK